MLTRDTQIIGYRIDTCKSCDKLSKLNFCELCGCFMPAKVRLKTATCPEGKWGQYFEPINQTDTPPV